MKITLETLDVDWLIDQTRASVELRWHGVKRTGDIRGREYHLQTWRPARYFHKVERSDKATRHTWGYGDLVVAVFVARRPPPRHRWWMDLRWWERLRS